SVLITGESGTGKELVAQAIHHASHRHDQPFVKVNCAALAESLLESELFGHVKGSFTDAIRDRIGRFEEAHGGTIFLDEIGDLPLNTQVKLLRVLQEKEFERVGDNRSIKVDVRIIAATHKDIPQLILEGGFREDFYYRINVIPISVPPLRERKTDIPLLLDHFIRRFCDETGKHIIACDQKTLDLLMNYNWPGNVRELENAIEFAFVTCCSQQIRMHNIPEQVRVQSPAQHIKPQGQGGSEREQILQMLKAAHGNKTRAAEMLGYSRVTLWKKIKKLDLQIDDEDL
ncbi:MAG: sigma-54-dependent Fis family transcriptional regulator, partial [Deltaproteobacteria bacterium]|nr:sigma-54-dependent Fis family transcriptional regulator [Deltaproteobacteria bacterium]